jgi:hypothetical protein
MTHGRRGTAEQSKAKMKKELTRAPSARRGEKYWADERDLNLEHNSSPMLLSLAVFRSLLAWLGKGGHNLVDCAASACCFGRL